MTANHSIIAWRLRLQVLIAALPLALVAFGRDEQPAQSSTDSQIAHGHYLVQHVAQCVQCHTPRDEEGELIESRSMQGAVIPIAAPRFAIPWAAQSVDLASLGNYDPSFIRFLLRHGKRPDGTTPRSPMPKFQLRETDADAIIAYLRSL